MKAALTDKVLGKLEWDEDTETYTGSVSFPPEDEVAFSLVVNNADEVSPREFTAFLSAARKHFEQLRKDDSRYRKRAADVVGRLKKGDKPADDARPVVESLRVHSVTIDNTGITMLYYDTGDLLPAKQRYIAVGFDMSGEIQLARAVRQPE